MGEVRFKYLEELEKSEALDALNDRKSKKRESTDTAGDYGSDRERARTRERAESAAERRRRNTAADQTRRRRTESERIEELLREEETEEDALYNERRQRRLRARRAEQRRQLHRRRVIIAYTLRALTALVLFLVVFNTTRVIVHIVSRGDNPIGRKHRNNRPHIKNEKRTGSFSPRCPGSSTARRGNSGTCTRAPRPFPDSPGSAGPSRRRAAGRSRNAAPPCRKSSRGVSS